MSKQIELENPDLKQQINFIGRLEQNNAAMFFIKKKLSRIGTVRAGEGTVRVGEGILKKSSNSREFFTTSFNKF